MRSSRSVGSHGLAVAGVASACALLLAACGGSGAGADVQAPVSFVGEPFATVPTSTGRLRVSVRWSPVNPVKGSDAAELTIVDTSGTPVDGLAVAVLPWMPAHAHGTSVQPVITTSAPGVFVANPLYLFMSGAWQLRITLTGAIDDLATATVEIP